MIGCFVGPSVVGMIGDGVIGCLVGLGVLSEPSLTQTPLRHAPRGTALQGVLSGTFCGKGQFPSD